VRSHYCSECGQETKLHLPSAQEFLHEFVSHYVALEGRLWKSLYYLLCKPGLLTAEYIAGRRRRYVEPLRLYLTFSVIFFAILKFTGPSVADFDAVVTEPAAEHRLASKPAAPKQGLQSGEASFDQLVGLSPGMEKKLHDFMAKPLPERARVLTAAFYNYVPYALFLLMPVFALYLKVLYLGSGRRYGEHLLFALHSNAFAFIMLGLLISVSRMGWSLLNAALILWLVFYLPTAMRRVYGGSRMLTGLRWIVLAIVHVLSGIGAILAASAMALVS
jgi:hypothetical protein